MRLDDVRGDGAMEDRRGQRSAGGGLGGLGAILGGGKGAKVGIPGLIILVVGFLVSQAGGGSGGGGSIGEVLEQIGGQGGSSQPAPAGTDGSSLAQYEFVDDVTTLLTDHWEETFASSGEEFEAPTTVVFDAPTQTGGCGIGRPESGPFYCPADSKIYIDFGFYERLEDQLGFEGDFAMAYVLAHEYGHHIQNLLGIDDQVRQQQDGAPAVEANALSVKVELQADCFAGVWARSAYEDDRLEDGDFDEAIVAAEAVGDDAIGGPGADRETFTHGSSAERQRWFRTGFDSADPATCDTFA